MPDQTPASAAHQTNGVDIAVPLSAEHAATLRVLVSSLGADAGFSIDEIDDMKLAVSEVFTVLIDSNIDGRFGRAHVEMLPAERSLTVKLRGGDVGGRISLDPLATTILSSVVDSYTVAGSSVTLVKRSTESPS